MKQYIDKSVIVSELEKRIEETKGMQPKFDQFWAGQISAFKGVLKILANLETKEVELTWEDVREICTQSVLVEIDLGGLVSDERHYTEVLKRFEAQKGE